MTAKYLRNEGVHVDISSSRHHELGAYDLVHIFGLHPDCLFHVMNARAHNKRVVLCPIYWGAYPRAGAMRRLEPRNLVQSIQNSLPLIPRLVFRDFLMRTLTDVRDTGSPPTRLVLEDSAIFNTGYYPPPAPYVLKGSDLIISSGKAEVEQIQMHFPATIAQKEKFVVILDGVDHALFANAKAEPFVRRYGLKNYVLCVGGIREQKNQLSLIRALKNSGIRLVILGQASEKAYFKKCKEEADSSVTFLGGCAHDKLPSVYAAAKVHVLPSYYDTPGLVSLEAAASGCNVVSTKVGCAQQYFGELAWYCNPYSVESIREATLAAYNAETNERLRGKVLSELTWEQTARKTLQAYDGLLNQ